MTLALAALAVPAMVAQKNNPEQLYLVGDMNGWNITAGTNNDILVYDEETETYTGEFEIGASQYFRFFRQLSETGDWEEVKEYSVGADADSNVAWTPGVTMDMRLGSESNWQATDWNGGKVEIIVDWGEFYVVFQEVTENEPPTSYEIYVRGTMNEWGAEPDWMLKQSSSNSSLYEGTFIVEADQAEFKIADSNWGAINYGGGSFQVYSNQPYTATLEFNAGNLVCTNWEGGEMQISFNLETLELTVNGPGQPASGDAPGEEPGDTPDPAEGVLYLIGTPQDWNINGDSMPLAQVEEGVFKAAYDIAAYDIIYFRFYSALGDWEANSIGSALEDGDNLPISLPYSGECVEGKGNWVIENWEGGYITFTVDLNNNNVEFEAGNNAAVSSIAASNADGYTVYTLTGVKVMETRNAAELNGLNNGLYIINGKKVVIR